MSKDFSGEAAGKYLVESLDEGPRYLARLSELIKTALSSKSTALVELAQRNTLYRNETPYLGRVACLSLDLGGTDWNAYTVAEHRTTFPRYQLAVMAEAPRMGGQENGGGDAAPDVDVPPPDEVSLHLLDRGRFQCGSRSILVDPLVDDRGGLVYSSHECAFAPDGTQEATNWLPGRLYDIRHVKYRALGIRDHTALVFMGMVLEHGQPDGPVLDRIRSGTDQALGGLGLRYMGNDEEAVQKNDGPYFSDMLERAVTPISIERLVRD